MVKEIRIYVEGGGDRRDDRRNLRIAFGQFFDELRNQPKSNGTRLRVVPSGGRSQTHRAYRKAANQYQDAFNILLVDSEGPVHHDTPSWKHLCEREEDKWDLCDKDERHCHLMVQAMEAWFVADKSALSRFYGQGFSKTPLPRRADVEEIPKDALYDSLKRATQRTVKGEYHKTRHGPKILELLDAAKVRAAAPHCERLFVVLEKEVVILSV